MNKKKLNKAVVFLTGSSITNPILFTQGLPLLNSLHKNRAAGIIISIEKNKTNPQVAEKIQNIKSRYENLRFIQLNESKGKILPGWIMIIYKVLKEINQLKRSFDIRILHSRGLFPSIISYCGKKILSKNLQFIYDNRGVQIDEEIYKGRWKEKSIKVKFFRFIEKRVIINSSYVVVVSQQFKKHLLELFKKPSFQNKIIVIPNRTILPQINKKFLPQLKHKNKIICAYSGSAASWQSLDKMLKFMINAIKHINNIQFRIITYEADFFHLFISKNPSLKERVEIITAEPKDVYKELIKCNLGLLFRETSIVNKVASPLKFAEYLAAGLPVLISEEIGDSEIIVNDYKIGTVIKNDNYEDALNQVIALLQQDDIYVRCRNLAEEQFSITDSIKEYLNLYNKLMI